MTTTYCDRTCADTCKLDRLWVSMDNLLDDLADGTPNKKTVAAEKIGDIAKQIVHVNTICQFSDTPCCGGDGDCCKE